MDGGKNILQPGPVGIKTDRKQVLLGVIGHCHVAGEGGNGGAHGVRTAASHEPALLHHARHPEFEATEIHGEPSTCLVLPAP